MIQSDNRKERLNTIKEELVRPTIRIILALVILFIVRFALIRFPGTDLVIFEPNTTVALLVYGVVTLLMMAAVLNYVTTVGAIVAERVGGTEVKRVIQLVGVLVVLIWAYPSFGWAPYFATHPAQYDVLFLLVGLLFGGWLAVLLYTKVDQFSALVAEQLITSVDSDAETESETNPVGSDHQRSGEETDF